MESVQLKYNSNELLNKYIDAINTSNDMWELVGNLNELCEYIESHEDDFTDGVQDTLIKCGFNFSYNGLRALGIEPADGEMEWYRVIEEEDE